MKKFVTVVVALCTAFALTVGCAAGSASKNESDGAANSGDQASADVSSEKTEAGSEEKSLRIIGTSDLHGKFLPWDYALNAESTTGSVAQLSTALKEYRTDNTLLFDAGDTIQDNYSDIFVGEDDVHPMIQAINALKYDAWTIGNHEFNYGMDVVKKTIGDLECTALGGNVYDENGEPIADGYTIIEKDGIRVAVIGMVTPNITRWDSVNLADCMVTDPLEETRKIIDSIKGQYDVLVGVYHMGIDNEYDVPNSGVEDILKECPEFDVMLASHAHALVEGETINGTLVVMNTEQAKTFSVIDLTLEKDGDGYKVADKTSKSVETKDYEADPEIVSLLGKYDEQAKNDANSVIGKLTGDQLSPANEIEEIPTAQIEDTALIDLINDVQLHYTGAKVSAAALFTAGANMYPGDIKKCDTALIYKYTNTLYKLHMTGAQLKKYMEWSASYFNTFKSGDLTISFNPDIRAYNFDMFAGVNYEINISKEPGSRIENLTWPDGKPVRDDEEFDIAVNNYRASSHLLTPGEVYEEGEELPQLVEIDVRGDIGGVRELIGDYITNVKKGTIKPECDHNWKITGYEWDETLREKALEQLKNKEIEIPSSEDGRTPNVKAITEKDLK